jgi:hypothetical protein
MEHRSAQKPGAPDQPRPACVDDAETDLPPGRPWPVWACWLVSILLVFHITAIVTCEVAGQVTASTVETDIARKFWWYAVLIHQELAHSFFAPEPDPASAVITARLAFDDRPDVKIRIPDRSARPHIRYLRQLALTWHVVHEWTAEGSPSRPYWAASYARHLCRTHPGCKRVNLYFEWHQMANPKKVVDAAVRGERVDLDALEQYSEPVSIGAFECDQF